MLGFGFAQSCRAEAAVCVCLIRQLFYCCGKLLRKAEPRQLSRRREQLISIIDDDDIRVGQTYAKPRFEDLRCRNFLLKNGTRKACCTIDIAIAVYQTVPSFVVF